MAQPRYNRIDTQPTKDDRFSALANSWVEHPVGLFSRTMDWLLGKPYNWGCGILKLLKDNIVDLIKDAGPFGKIGWVILGIVAAAIGTALALTFGLLKLPYYAVNKVIELADKGLDYLLKKADTLRSKWLRYPAKLFIYLFKAALFFTDLAAVALGVMCTTASLPFVGAGSAISSAVSAVPIANTFTSGAAAIGHAATTAGISWHALFAAAPTFGGHVAATTAATAGVAAASAVVVGPVAYGANRLGVKIDAGFEEIDNRISRLRGNADYHVLTPEEEARQLERAGLSNDEIAKAKEFSKKYGHSSRNHHLSRPLLNSSGTGRQTGPTSSRPSLNT